MCIKLCSFSFEKIRNEHACAVDGEECKGCKEEQYYPRACRCFGRGGMQKIDAKHRNGIVDKNMKRALCVGRHTLYPKNEERKSEHYRKQRDNRVGGDHSVGKGGNTVYAYVGCFGAGIFRCGGDADGKNGGPKEIDNGVRAENAQAAFKQSDLFFVHYFLMKQEVFSESASGATDATITHSILCAEVIFSTLQTNSSKAFTSSLQIFKALSIKSSVIS